MFGFCRRRAKAEPLLQDDGSEKSAAAGEEPKKFDASVDNNAHKSLSKTYGSSVKHMIYAAIGVGFLAVYPWGLVTQMHNVRGSMVPCSTRCLQFKVWADESHIPNTGPIPYQVANGRDISWGEEDLEKVWPHMVVEFTQAKLKQFPSLKCPGNSTDDMVKMCSTPDVLNRVYNPASHSVAYIMFVTLLGVWCCVSWLHDTALADGCDEEYTLPLQVLATMLMMCITSYAFHWAECSMELFFSPLDENVLCGCLFRLDDIPMLLALSVPFSLFHQTITMTHWTMRACLGGDYLIGQSYKVAHRHVSTTVTDSWSSLVGAHSVGAGSQSEPERLHSKEGPPTYPSWFYTTTAMLPLGFIVVWMPASRATVNLWYRASDLLGERLSDSFEMSVIAVTLGEWFSRTTVLWAMGNFLYLGVFTLLPIMLILPRRPLMVALWRLGQDEGDASMPASNGWSLATKFSVVACVGIITGIVLFDVITQRGGDSLLVRLALQNFLQSAGYLLLALLYVGFLLFSVIYQFWLSTTDPVVKHKELKWIYTLQKLKDMKRKESEL